VIDKIEDNLSNILEDQVESAFRAGAAALIGGSAGASSWAISGGSVGTATGACPRSDSRECSP
jgi:hypothetical protein